MGFAICGAFAEPTARLFVVLYFALFVALVVIRKALESTRCIKQMFNSLPQKKKVSIVEHILSFGMEICGMCLIFPNIGALLANNNDDSNADAHLLCAFTLLFVGYSLLMVVRAPYAPTVFFVHHFLVIGCGISYFALASVHRQPVTKVVTVLVMELVLQQLRHVAWLLRAFRVRASFTLIMIDTIWQLVLKTSTKITACVFWWGTWHEYGDDWFWLWAIAFPVVHLLLYTIQLHFQWIQWNIGKSDTFNTLLIKR